MSLFDALNGAELVIADEDLGLLFVWNGSRTVNIIDANGNAVDVFTTRDRVTVYRARRLIEEHRAQLHGDLEDEDES